LEGAVRNQFVSLDVGATWSSWCNLMERDNLNYDTILRKSTTTTPQSQLTIKEMQYVTIRSRISNLLAPIGAFVI
jgi:hypothetical protein